MFIIISLILALALGLTLRNRNYWKRKEYAQYKNSMHWYQMFMDQREGYIALEQGRDEESESYEMQFLSFKEDIGVRDIALGSYKTDLEFLVPLVRGHLDHCLRPVNIDQDMVERFEEIEAGVMLQQG